VSGIDISIVAFAAQQLDITPDVVVPGSMARVRQLLNEEPGKEFLGTLRRPT
jgi:hypothetical protein